jgi:hypothetical protein
MPGVDQCCTGSSSVGAGETFVVIKVEITNDGQTDRRGTAGRPVRRRPEPGHAPGSYRPPGVELFLLLHLIATVRGDQDREA